MRLFTVFSFTPVTSAISLNEMPWYSRRRKTSRCSSGSPLSALVNSYYYEWSSFVPLDRWIPEPREQAAFAFLWKTLFRSRSHRLFLLAYAGAALGWACTCVALRLVLRWPPPGRALQLALAAAPLAAAVWVALPGSESGGYEAVRPLLAASGFVFTARGLRVVLQSRE